MEKKESRRVKMTKRMLKDALIELLREKDIYNISIRELCDHADVNRTTFYKYYGSQFDLLTDIEIDVITFINRTIEKNNSNIESIIQSICEYLEDNLELARMLINNNVDPDFPEKLFSLEIIRENVFRDYENYDNSQLEYVYNYITYGSFRIISMWINKDKRESPKELALLIKNITIQK